MESKRTREQTIVWIKAAVKRQREWKEEVQQRWMERQQIMATAV